MITKLNLLSASQKEYLNKTLLNVFLIKIMINEHITVVGKNGREVNPHLRKRPAPDCAAQSCSPYSVAGRIKNEQRGSEPLRR